MKFRLVQNIGGRWVKTEGEAEEALLVLGAMGYGFARFNDNPRQRAELQGLPIFEGLRGPMWDGDAIRYEDEEANRILSA